VQELTRNDTFETPSTEAAIPSGGVPLLSKQLRETMEKVQWHPMRVAYDRGDRVLAIRDELKRRGVEHFLPMHWEYTKDELNAHKQLKPAINGLIFIHASRWDITELKKMPGFEALRYWMDKTKGENVEDRVLTVPDAQMQNFMRVASMTDDSVMFLNDETVVGKEGKRVLITGGIFNGVTGVIRRVKRCKRVVVELDGLATVAIAFVPAILLKELEN
jgi:hypothetical protein